MGNTNQLASNVILSSHHASYDRKRGPLKVVFLGTGEGGKATMYKQLIHLYGNKKCTNKKSQDNSGGLLDPKDVEDDFANSFQNEETRKSFIPIIHRNTLLAMYNLLNGAINFFRYDLELDTKPIIKSAVDAIFEERDHAISFEEWYLKPLTAQHIAYLWNNVPYIQETYRRRNELELEYMESAKYWFQEINRIITPNYVPSMRDIFRVRVKTTGIVESEIQVPIKIKKRHKSPLSTSNQVSDSIFNSQKTSGTLDDGQLKYKRVKLVLMGSQRNERKKWIHAFNDVSAVIFVVALSEYNQVLYEDGRTNRLHESLLLFDEIVNSSYFVNVPIYLFLNKKDVFLEKISVWDLSGVFPDLPRDLRLTEEENPQAKFVPNLIAARVVQQNEEMMMHTPKGMDQIVTISEDDIDEKGTKKNNRFKHFLKNRVRKRKSNHRTIEPSQQTSHEDRTVKRRSSVFMQLIEAESLARKSSLPSITKFALQEIDHKNSNSVYTDVDNNFNTLMSLPTDALIYVCLFMEAPDLCRLNLVNHEMYSISNSEIVWRALCLRYGEVDEENVIAFYEEWLENQAKEGMEPVVIQSKRGSFRIPPLELRSKSQSYSLREDSTIRKGRYKHYFEMGSQYAARNIAYIHKAFMEKTTRTDIITFVTCAVDSATFKPLLEQTMMRIIRKPQEKSEEDEEKQQ
jgi:hypothetical protein